jgi:hypothetical protein
MAQQLRERMNKKKDEQIGLHQTKKLLYSKRNSKDCPQNGRKSLPAIHPTRD